MSLVGRIYERTATLKVIEHDEATDVIKAINDLGAEVIVTRVLLAELYDEV